MTQDIVIGREALEPSSDPRGPGQYVFVYEYKHIGQLKTVTETMFCVNGLEAHEHAFKRAKELGITIDNLRSMRYFIHGTSSTIGCYRGNA